jgi:hypothetical protein
VTSASLLRVAALAALAPIARGQADPPAQDPGAPQPPTALPAPMLPPATGGSAAAGAGLQLFADWASSSQRNRDDYREVHVYGGFQLRVPELGITIRGGNALLLLDLDAWLAATQTLGGSRGLPHRGMPAPAARRLLTNDEIRARLENSLRAIGRAEPLPSTPVADQALDLLRYLYCEEGVVVVRDGVEVVRCDRLWLSPLDDRIVVEGVELRYPASDRTPDEFLVVRGPKLVKEGPRWTGRDLTITSCTAAVPHFALAVDDAEIIERDGEFEVVARGQTLQVGGVGILPLPDARFFTGSQSQFPIKRVRAGYSGRLGMQTEVVLGLPWNGAGGALHEWLTGRPASEFRGDWELGLGWIQERGFPLDGELNYRAGKLYRGSTEVFFLSDQGEDIREFRTGVYPGRDAGESRGLIRTQNRISFREQSYVDLVAYQMSDPGVLPEFFGNVYRSEETPETSAYLHHGDGNQLLTIGSRFTLNDFSYRDDRALADRFVEELPVLTYQWLAQPIGETPWQTPVIADLTTEIGQRRSNYDDRSPLRESDRSLRIDQLAEVSAPFTLAGWQLRPHFNTRGSFYDTTRDGSSEGRVAMETGASLSTRFSRTWTWFDDDLGDGGQADGIRHVMSPKLGYRNRFHVDDSATEFFAFDGLDTLAEQQLVRVELRNSLQQMRPIAGVQQPRDVVFLDLAQDFFPDAARDNAGDDIGLFYYDLLLRPDPGALPLQRLSYAIYGDHDWRNGLRTLDTELQFGPVLGLDWGFQYRTDAFLEGAVGFNASTQWFGRWNANVGGQYALEPQVDADGERNPWTSWSMGLVRNDHDWSIGFSAIYNTFTDETTFRLEFMPRLGGGIRPQRDRFGAGVPNNAFGNSH